MELSNSGREKANAGIHRRSFPMHLYLDSLKRLLTVPGKTRPMTKIAAIKYIRL